MKMKEQTTLVTTCFNEISNVERWVDDVKRQTYSFDEICIVDAGSSDGTLEYLKEWAHEDHRVSVKVINKCNVARGRNEAIRMSRGDIILSTDMGCSIDKKWAAEMIKPFIDDNDVEVVAGNYGPDMATIKTKVSKIFYCINNGYRPRLHARFLPSSRSIAYRRQVWEKLEGYPEWLTFAGDDTLFAVNLLKMNCRIKLSPEAMVYWGRHAKLLDYRKEAERYGLGDAEASLFLNSFILERFTHLAKYPLLLLGAIFVSFGIYFDTLSLEFCGLIFAGIAGAFFIIQSKRCILSLIRHDKSLLAYSPLAVILKDLVDISYSIGYLKGLTKIVMPKAF